MRKHPILKEIKERHSNPIQMATLVFLIDGNNILLAMKKRGFATGKWNGAGGKMDKRDKTIKEAAIREVEEEIGVVLLSLKQTAILNFYHLGKQDFSQQVTVYISNQWKGEPKESEEMAPKWFDINELPYNEMWEDDKLWLPRILNGEIIEGDFLFDEDQILLEQNIRVEK